MQLNVLTRFVPDNTYYIPICIWLMDTHPQNAPLCYVKPTADMSINVSMFVDHNGKVYLPYLHDWQPVSAMDSLRYEGEHYLSTLLSFQNVSDVLGLIQVMIITFGESPPVFAKPKQPTAYPSNRELRFHRSHFSLLSSSLASFSVRFASQWRWLWPALSYTRQWWCWPCWGSGSWLPAVSVTKLQQHATLSPDELQLTGGRRNEWSRHRNALPDDQWQ